MLSDKHIVHVIGTRPQFPKCAPVYRALQGTCKQTVIHTGQHYDDTLSKNIIEDTDCHIDIVLYNNMYGRPYTKGITNDLIKGYIKDLHSDLVMVYGDCNTSLDGAKIAASIPGIKIAHVEAGLRCGDMRMIEEYNRIEIDKIADILYVPSVDAVYNLARAGVPFDMIQFVGNVMADTYYWLKTDMWSNIHRLRCGLITMHRPENVDDKRFMEGFLNNIKDIPYQFLFPKHPRVILPFIPCNITVVEPMRYRVFMRSLLNCSFVVTDSGGVQEEAALTHTPCLTMRPSTERPITITHGTNELSTPEQLNEQVKTILDGKWKQGSIPVYWDGHAAERIAAHLSKYYE